jgi:hypothetical protein
VENRDRGLSFFPGGGWFRYIYLGAKTTHTFAKGDFTRVSDRESFYQKLCAVHSKLPSRHQPSFQVHNHLRE